MIRDLEIQRLISYIEGLGLKVKFTSKDINASATWSLDNTEIEICKKYNTTKIETVLSLVHEIGHAKHNIHEKNREIDPKFESALDHVDEAEEQEVDSQRRQRKIILNNEIAGTNYWDGIYLETNLQFPKWLLEAQKVLDIWSYEVFYETGHFPYKKDRRMKSREVKAKFRRKYE